MTVLIVDKFEPSGVAGLEAIGATVIYNPDLSGDLLVNTVATVKPDVLIVRGTKIDAATIAGSTIRLSVRAGAGLNTIDVDAARRAGIVVRNCPGLNAIAVAELTMGLILALDRRIAANIAELQAGHWNKREFAHARGLFGRTLGLIGFGRIGEEVAVRARAFGMRVLAWSRRFSTGAATPPHGVTAIATPADLAAHSDVLSVHLALTPETRGFVDRAILERLPRDAMFVNTARADVVNAAALAEAIRHRGLRVALDVWSAEPEQGEGTIDDPLIHLPNVIGTHHIGGSTDQAQEAIAEEVVRIIRDWSTT